MLTVRENGHFFEVGWLRKEKCASLTPIQIIATQWYNMKSTWVYNIFIDRITNDSTKGLQHVA